MAIKLVSTQMHVAGKLFWRATATASRALLQRRGLHTGSFILSCQAAVARSLEQRTSF